MQRCIQDIRRFSTTCRNMGKILTVQDSKEFEDLVIKSNKSIIVDFYADWCGPCRMLAPKLETALADEVDVDLLKVNVDNLDELAAKYQVKTIPHVIGFKRGKAIDTFIGNKDNDIIKQLIAKVKEA